MFNKLMLKSALSQLAAKMQNEKIKAILVIPGKDTGEVEIEYLDENSGNLVTIGEVVVMTSDEYKALRTLANKTLLNS